METDLIPIIRAYALTLKDGSVLKDIAYRTISDMEIGRVVPQRRVTRGLHGTKCKDILGREYISLTALARKLKVDSETISKDMRSGGHKYGAIAV